MAETFASPEVAYITLSWGVTTSLRNHWSLLTVSDINRLKLLFVKQAW